MLMQRSIVAGGVASTVLENTVSTTPLVFLNGGVPGISPFCSGTHIWRGCLERFASERSVLALDLPGTGGSGVPNDGLTVDAIVRQVRASLDALGVQGCHVVGHDLGGLVALALSAEMPSQVRGVTVVSSVAAAPTGDSVENLALAYPPMPLWSRDSQRWALERLSYSHRHIDAELLDACVRANAGDSHRAAKSMMASGAHGDALGPSLLRAKARLY